MIAVKLQTVLDLHDSVVLYSKALVGVRDRNLLMSAINVQSQGWYNGIDNILWVAFSICKGHIFNDGNKRTAYLVIRLLTEYGYYLSEGRLSDVILQLASSDMSKELFFKRCYACIY